MKDRKHLKINPVHITTVLYKLPGTKALFTTKRKKKEKKKNLKAHMMLQSFILAKPTPFLYLILFKHDPKANPLESHKYVTDSLLQSKPSQVNFRPEV